VGSGYTDNELKILQTVCVRARKRKGMKERKNERDEREEGRKNRGKGGKRGGGGSTNEPLATQTSSTGLQPSKASLLLRFW
jgi:hypothetical protein